MEINLTPPLPQGSERKRLIEQAIGMLKDKPWTFARLFFLHGLVLFAAVVAVRYVPETVMGMMSPGIGAVTVGAVFTFVMLAGAFFVFVIPQLMIVAYQGCLEAEGKAPPASLLTLCQRTLYYSYRLIPERRIYFFGLLLVACMVVASIPSLASDSGAFGSQDIIFVGMDIAVTLTCAIPLAFIFFPTAFAAAFYEMRWDVDVRQHLSMASPISRGHFGAQQQQNIMSWGRLWPTLHLVMMVISLLIVSSWLAILIWVVFGGAAYVLYIALYIHCREQIDGESASVVKKSAPAVVPSST